MRCQCTNAGSTPVTRTKVETGKGETVQCSGHEGAGSIARVGNRSRRARHYAPASGLETLRYERGCGGSSPPGGTISGLSWFRRALEFSDRVSSLLTMDVKRVGILNRGIRTPRRGLTAASGPCSSPRRVEGRHHVGSWSLVADVAGAVISVGGGGRRASASQPSRSSSGSSGDTHVEVTGRKRSDAGSIPARSTTSRGAVRLVRHEPRMLEDTHRARSREPAR